jgi:hypothetical protein
MSLETAIAYFAQRQADLFRSTCTITRATAGTFDEGTGAITPGTPTSVYSGACLIRPFSWEGSDTQVGQQEVRYRGARLKLPPDTDIEKDDIVTVTGSDHDADLVGRTFRITDVLRDDWQIVRVAILEEAT